MRRRTVSVLRPVRTHIHGCRADCVLTDARQLVEEQVYLYTYLVEIIVQANNKERLHIDCCLWFCGDTSSPLKALYFRHILPFLILRY